MKYVNKGFTLIELMIVIAILGILLMIAIPAFQDYATRAKVSEGINLAATAKSSVSETKASTGKFPASNASAGLPSPASISGNDVGSITISGSGLITILYSSTDANINGKDLVFTPTSAGGSVKWACTASGTVEDRFRPANCR